jgi:glutamate-1-semialdehyde aminotransferase
MKDTKLKLINDFTLSKEYQSKIHSLIPGGAQTYSKGDDQWPLLAPTAIKKGHGAYVWDLDDNKFLDCSMGLTSVSLGHAYPPVLEKVIQSLYLGTNFQRPSYIEKEMAEIFLNLLPGHDMIKFAKNGSSVTTAAVKLARAFTNRKLVAFPSDHPFYSYDDWFIGTTECSRGVPSEISQLSLRFLSTDLKTLQDLFDKYPNQIACVITEPEKSNINDPSYVKNISSLCKKNGALFIMDEMITGFKVDFPGAFSKYGVVPDMATWGKGIANGFSFCALTGTKEVMELGGIINHGEEKVFLISSTHGGEVHSMAACMATIFEFKEKNVLKHNHEMGTLLSTEVEKIIKQNNLEEFILLTKSTWMPMLQFKNASAKFCNGYRTLFLQEMIKRGVLFQGIFIPCFSHTKTDIELFCAAFSESTLIYKKALELGYEKFLIGTPTKPVFRKYL